MRAGVAAELLQTAARTLRHWRAQTDRRGTGRGVVRGRPCKTASRETLAEVRRFLREVSGPAVGLAALRALFPDAPRCVLADHLRRYRRVWRRRYREHGWRLTWKRSGAVWAIDFSEPRQPVDGVFAQLFAVRDLASHEQLAWTPVKGATAEQAMAVLRDLFQEHGPPLVLKCDNGSAFISEDFQTLLAEHEVLALYSPPRRPQYNGALERSNGVLKTYTQQHAAAEQHPFRWTSDDVEAARRLANTMSRPWGHRRPTPEEAWQARERIGDDQRRLFQEAVQRERAIARSELGLPAGALSREEQARVDRLALPRVLAELGHLTMHRADRPPKKPKRLSRAELALRAADTPGAPPAKGTVDQPAAPTSGAPPASDAVPIAADSAPTPSTGAAVAEPPVDSPPAALPAAGKSLNAPLNKASSADGCENEKAQLAPPTAADTMRARAGDDADVHSAASPPAPVPVEPAKPPWPLRFITPLFARVKTAMIT